jgi:hypothetical protein
MAMNGRKIQRRGDVDRMKAEYLKDEFLVMSVSAALQRSNTDAASASAGAKAEHRCVFWKEAWMMKRTLRTFARSPKR